MQTAAAAAAATAATDATEQLLPAPAHMCREQTQLHGCSAESPLK
jgi:hypothetical protein